MEDGGVVRGGGAAARAAPAAALAVAAAAAAAAAAVEVISSVCRFPIGGPAAAIGGICSFSGCVGGTKAEEDPDCAAAAAAAETLTDGAFSNARDPAIDAGSAALVEAVTTLDDGMIK